MLYKELAGLYESLESTPKRLEKTRLIADFLRQTSADDLEQVILLLQGRVFPLWDKRVLGLSEKLVVKAISTSSGASERRVVDEWRELGDIGKVAEKLVAGKTQATLTAEDLSVARVFDNLRKVAASEGKGAQDLKVKLVAQLLSSARGVEARYVVRSVIGDLRVGVAEGTLRDSLVWAFLVDRSPDEALEGEARETYDDALAAVQAALDRSNDFGKVAKIAKEKGLDGLKRVSIEPGKPLKVMLAQKADGFDEAFEKVGTPCAIEYKYDGFRLQVHGLEDGSVRLFTRRLEEVTAQFPDVVRAVRKHVKGGEFILDAEAVGYDPSSGSYRPFQEVSQRIRRKYDIATLEKKLPVEVAVFDVLYHDGSEYLEKPLRDRWSFLKSIVDEKSRSLVLARHESVEKSQVAERFYKESLDAGNEGVMVKNLDGVYRPGSRVGTMLKLKPSLDTFDLAIVGAEWGTGKRSGWLTSFTVACWDDHDEELVTVGRFGTGIKEKADAAEDGITFQEVTDRLKPLITSTEGREVSVRPEVVVEVRFEEIQKSPSYSSGFALRFPRFVQLRDDRGLDDMTTLSMVEAAYRKQRGGR
ncbi:MAG: ATP-dependent DNA ligase [Candidatus Woesearchaeota archaeon]